MRSARRSRALVALAVTWFWACSDPATTPSEVEQPDNKPSDSQPTMPALIVSEAIPSAAQALGATASRGVAGVAYVSLPPGTVPSAVSVRIRNVTAGGSQSGPIDVFAGGFDPVAVAGNENDQLELVFTGESGGVTSAYIKIPKRRPPVIVRTSPPKGRTDVPLGSRLSLVFSEPIDAGTIGTVRLLRGGASVTAQVERQTAAAWVVDVVPGGALQPLTTYQLVIPPDVRDLEGDAFADTETVTFTTGPVLSLPGRIAFASTRDGASHVYLANGDGSAVRRLTSGEKPAWSPDGRRIAFERGGIGQGPFPQGSTIYLINADGSGETQLIEGMHAAWSPDGNRIAFLDSAGISVINVDGSGLTRLIRHDVALGVRTGFYVGNPAWSPDGTRIAFEHGNEGEPQRIYVMRADGTGPALLTNQPVELGVGAECGPAWSPDGSSIAFWRFNLGIGTIPAIGASDPRRILQSTFPEVSCWAMPDWSPDGSTLAFAFFQLDAGRLYWRGRIYVVGALGGPTHLLIPEVAAPANPTYSDLDVAWSRAR